MKNKKIDKWAYFIAGIVVGMIIAFLFDSLLFKLYFT